jgi:hypothetical protein
LLALFTFLLCVVCAAPVLAQSDSETSPLSDEVSMSSESSAPAPGTEAIVGGYEAAKQKEEEREEELASPAAVEEREASRHAYAGIGAAEAEELLSAKFPEAFASLNADPARALSDVRLDRPLGEGDAVVTTEEGKTQLLESTFPVETENDEGEMEKVDVTLEKTSEGYVPENPVVEVAIAESAAEGIEIGGEEGAGEEAAPITVTQVGAVGSTARPFGDMNVFFGEVEPGSDTDQLVAPTETGVELLDMLRSADSP